MDKNSYVVIEINDKLIKILEGQRDKNKITVKSSVMADLPNAIVKNSEIIDSKALGDLIHEEILKSGMKTNDAIMVLSGDVAINREIIIPKLKEREIYDAMFIEASQKLPIDLKKYVIDYKILGEVENEGKPSYKLYISAVSKDMVNQCVNTLATTQLNFKAIDTPSNSALKFMNFYQQANNEDTDSLTALINIDYNFMSVIIMQGKQIKFEKVVNIGIQKLLVTIMNNQNVNEDKALQILNNNFEQYLASQNLNAFSIENRISKIVYTGICGSISKIFQFYLSKNMGQKFGNIYLTGYGYLKVPKLKPVIDQYLNVSTSQLNLNSCVINKSTNSFDQIGELSTNLLGGIIRE